MVPVVFSHLCFAVGGAGAVDSCSPRSRAGVFVLPWGGLEELGVTGRAGGPGADFPGSEQSHRSTHPDCKSISIFYIFNSFSDVGQASVVACTRLAVEVCKR